MTPLQHRRDWENLKDRERKAGRFPKPGDPKLSKLVVEGILQEAVPGALENSFEKFLTATLKRGRIQ